MQSTGLTDKNGKEIFEGDILEDIPGLLGVVAWDQEEGRYRTKYDTPLVFPHRTVIGNVFENPDLLS